jgi:hypothetical protein
MTSFYGEIGYALGNHFTLTANWIHGLNPYLLNQVDQMTADNAPSGKRTDYIRGLSLGVRYNL